MKILVACGVNLDLLGKRQTQIYGHHSLLDMEKLLLDAVKNSSDFNLDFFQTNSESEYLDKISGTYDWMILNPGAWTHTSLALRDRLLALESQFIEVHCSNIKKRENFRKFSYIEDVAIKQFQGNGIHSFLDALNYIISNHAD